MKGGDLLGLLVRCVGPLIIESESDRFRGGAVVGAERRVFLHFGLWGSKRSGDLSESCMIFDSLLVFPVDLAECRVCVPSQGTLECVHFGFSWFLTPFEATRPRRRSKRLDAALPCTSRRTWKTASWTDPTARGRREGLEQDSPVCLG